MYLRWARIKGPAGHIKWKKYQVEKKGHIKWKKRVYQVEKITYFYHEGMIIVELSYAKNLFCIYLFSYIVILLSRESDPSALSDLAYLGMYLRWARIKGPAGHIKWKKYQVEKKGHIKWKKRVYQVEKITYFYHEGMIIVELSYAKNLFCIYLFSYIVILLSRESDPSALRARLRVASHLSTVPHQDGGIPQSAFPNGTISKLAGLFSTLSL